MIDRNREAGVFEVTCDECPDGFESYDVDDGWAEMIADLKASGWKIIPIDDGAEFEHVCPTCAEPKETDIESLFKGLL